MECHRLLLVLFLLPTASYGWWIFSSGESERDESNSSPETRRPVQFEMTTAEQKFLAEAQTFLDLPRLDQCQHVVSVLQVPVVPVVCYGVCAAGDLSFAQLLW